MSAKDKNGIELHEGDYVKIIVRVRAVGPELVAVGVGGESVFINGKDVEAVVFNESFPAGHGEPV